MGQYLRDTWYRITVRQKLAVNIALIVLVMVFFSVFTILILRFSLGDVNRILDDNVRCHEFQDALEQEIEAFNVYARNRTEENRGTYNLACVRTERCLASLPYDYEEIGEERYARTWNIRNSYEQYRRSRDRVLEMAPESSEYVASLYAVIDRQEYLSDYARLLAQLTVEEGNVSYQERAPLFYRMSGWIGLISLLMIAAAFVITSLVSGALLDPVVMLVRSARELSANNYEGADIVVPNQDEIGELVATFNRMKHATKGYIDTLRKNAEMAELLHRDEMERVEMERQMNEAQLELLKSQINPHFLFNTLNTIGCMAKLEDADTTGRMIRSLSHLFRYNLKTTEQFVTLDGELKVADDYIYIQKMRFGERLVYDRRVETDAKLAIIPSFSLQPVIENAVIHGIARKEEGGTLYLRIRLRGDVLSVVVADTGVGMSGAQLRELREALKDRSTSKRGIGLGNIYRRLHLLYEDGELKIHSRPGRGTVIRMRIPQKRGSAEE